MMNVDMHSDAVQEAIKAAMQPVVEIEILKSRPFITSREVEQVYGITAGALKAMRRDHDGPKFYQREPCGKVMYAHEDIQAWIKNNKARG